ncbi:hypothetical protein RGU12_04115 [Fredinandcohnia sp. QZ13]|uniref:hypothetical protein n=1 Tax=Fredinandcohnia sp. QZ13 TaxID=3073144 RepID=UPI002853732C|nr:hypothetical protein [Fredinandcohnia sp. QZ13]MDR4886737.1 hypothetical protein [Fredinandcohnia sp. QZ13]
MKKSQKKEEPTIAVGMDTEEELREDASMKEIEKGDYTQVTTLSYDENDPS